jgi:endogenous inhibitor of DNA gyrase (YacG/DUF329 family)
MGWIRGRHSERSGHGAAPFRQGWREVHAESHLGYPASMNSTKTASCPQCRKLASLDTANRFRPFCSERCKLLDLGEWFAEKHSIPVADSDSDPDEAPDSAQNPDRLQ